MVRSSSQRKYGRPLASTRRSGGVGASKDIFELDLLVAASTGNVPHDNDEDACDECGHASLWCERLPPRSRRRPPPGLLHSCGRSVRSTRSRPATVQNTSWTATRGPCIERLTRARSIVL